MQISVCIPSHGPVISLQHPGCGFKNTKKGFYKITTSCLCSSAGSRGSSGHCLSQGTLGLCRDCKYSCLVSALDALPLALAGLCVLPLTPSSCVC